MAIAQTRSSRETPLSVTDVVRHAKYALDGVGTLWLTAEVAAIKRPPSGHLYLQLRDQAAVLPAVMWARDAAKVGFTVEPGAKLLIRGRLGVYEGDGKMQLYAEALEPAGLGAAALALEQLRQKLAAEGIFANARKRALPRFPMKIGVVTSKNGAAVHDIVRTINRRWPTPIAVADCLVQGPGAPHAIVDAMVLAVKAGCDVIIVGRGGGASTDLSAFNHERVVRTVARCPVPVISAVGHEVDVTLCDLAADQRASTPTAAAELAVPDSAEVSEVLAAEARRLHREMRLFVAGLVQRFDVVQSMLSRAMERDASTRRAALVAWSTRLVAQHPRSRLLAQQSELAAVERRLVAAGPRVALTATQQQLTRLTQRLAAASPAAALVGHRNELDALRTRARELTTAQLALAEREFATLLGTLHALSPLAVMQRGFAVVRLASGDGTNRSQATGAIVRDARQLSVGGTVEVQLAQGLFSATVTATQTQPTATGSGPDGNASPKPGTGSGKRTNTKRSP